MKIKHNMIFVSALFIAACSQAPVQSPMDDVPQKVSRDYEAIGDATGIRPYVYGKHTLIKFEAGKPAFLSFKDENGASVGYKIQGGYYVLDRKLDSFTVAGLRRVVQFNLIQQEPSIVDVENTVDLQIESDANAWSLNESAEISADTVRKIKSSDPIYAIMNKQMQQHRYLLSIASEHKKYTGEELFQINSRLDLIEYKIANRDEAIVHVYFPFNNTTFKPETDLIDALLPLAKNAVSINVFGRTDSRVADEGNKQVAKGRVMATKEFLVAHGVPENIIHIDPRASGDFIAPAGMEDGRKLNRRVTIEVIMQ